MQLCTYFFLQALTAAHPGDICAQHGLSNIPDIRGADLYAELNNSDLLRARNRCDAY